MPLNKWWKSFHIFNSTRSEPQTPLNTAVAHCAHDRMWLYSIHRTVLCKMRSSEISLWWFPWLSSSRIFIRHWQTWRRTQKKICRKHFLLHNVNMCVVRFPPNQRKKNGNKLIQCFVINIKLINDKIQRPVFRVLVLGVDSSGAPHIK